jgi:hypothetical protein
MRCWHALHGRLGIRRANDILRRHRSVHLSRPSVPGVIWQETRSIHHVVELIWHVLRPASPVGVRGRLSSESQFDACKSVLPIRKTDNNIV